MNKTWIFRITLVILAVLLLAGCAPAAGTAITVTMTDYKYEPAEWRVPAGQEISITLTNTGKEEHEFVVMKAPASVPWNDADEPLVFWEHEVEGGKAETVKFTAPTTPGEYQIVCGQPAHIEQGMVGKLVVY